MTGDQKTLLKVIEGIGSLSPDGVIVYDQQQDSIIYHNPIAAQLFHAHPFSIPGLLQNVVVEDHEYLKRKHKTLLEEGVIMNVEFRHVKGPDDILHISGDAYLLSDLRCIVILLKDISQWKQHENYIVDFGAKKNTLLDIVVHNLSTPLTLIQKLTDQVNKSVDMQSTDHFKTYLNLVRDSTAHCIEIITNLIKVEHSESPAIDVVNSRFNVIEKINVLQDDLKGTYENKIFKFLYDSPIIYINSDDVKFLQIVTNLLSNAIKFTVENGEISIAVKEERNYIVVSIADNGLGIPENLKPFIFDKRTQAGRTGLKGERSLGLGLSIVKRLVDLLKGRIWFESEEGKGSTFFVEVPKE